MGIAEGQFPGLFQHSFVEAAAIGIVAVEVSGFIQVDGGQGRAFLFQPEVHQLLNFLVQHQGTLNAAGLRRVVVGQEHIPFAEEFFRAYGVENYPGVDLGSYGKGYFGRHIGLEQAGNYFLGGALGRQNQVDPGGPAHLGQPHQGMFHFGPADHHQVGQFVHNQHDEGQGVFGLGVVAGNVAGVDFRHLLVAAVHFPHQAFQHGADFIHIGDDRQDQMGDAVERRQFHLLGVNHQHPQLVGRLGHQERGDDGVDADAFAAAGGAGNHHVRQGGQIHSHRLAAGVGAQGNGQAALAHNLAEILGFHHFPHRYLAGGGSGQFQAEQSLARHRLEAQAGGADGQGQVFLPGHYAAYLDPPPFISGHAVPFIPSPFFRPTGLQAEADNTGAGFDVGYFDTDAVVGQGALDAGGHLFQGAVIGTAGFRGGKQFRRRQLPLGTFDRHRGQFGRRGRYRRGRRRHCHHRRGRQNGNCNGGRGAAARPPVQQGGKPAGAGFPMGQGAS